MRVTDQTEELIIGFDEYYSLCEMLDSPDEKNYLMAIEVLLHLDVKKNLIPMMLIYKDYAYSGNDDWKDIKETIVGVVKRTVAHSKEALKIVKGSSSFNTFMHYYVIFYLAKNYYPEYLGFTLKILGDMIVEHFASWGWDFLKESNVKLVMKEDMQQTVVFEDSEFNTLCQMFSSSDEKNHLMAMDVLLNMDPSENIAYILMANYSYGKLLVDDWAIVKDKVIQAFKRDHPDTTVDFTQIFDDLFDTEYTASRRFKHIYDFIKVYYPQHLLIVVNLWRTAIIPFLTKYGWEFVTKDLDIVIKPADHLMPKKP